MEGKRRAHGRAKGRAIYGKLPINQEAPPSGTCNNVRNIDVAV